MRRIVQTRQTGLFVEQRPRNAKNLSEDIAQIRGGQIIVVDIAKLTNYEQTLIFGDILRTVYALYAEEAQSARTSPISCSSSLTN